MRKKKSAINKNFFIFIICCILSIVLFFSKDINEVKKIKIHVSNFFSIIFSPKNSANDFLNLKSKNDSLINELKNMKNLNFELEQKINNIDLYSNYDKKLDKLISNYRFIPAKILNHSFSKSANILNLNIGLKDGVPKQYKAVVDYKGNLIGRYNKIFLILTKTMCSTKCIMRRSILVPDHHPPGGQGIPGVGTQNFEKSLPNPCPQGQNFPPSPHPRDKS